MVSSLRSLLGGSDDVGGHQRRHSRQLRLLDDVFPFVEKASSGCCREPCIRNHLYTLSDVFTPLGASLEKYSESGNATTLTGRTNLWAAAWPQIKSHPIFGNGYRASRFLSDEVQGAFAEAGNMHILLEEVLYNNGLVGLIPILIINVLIVVNLRKAIIRPLRCSYDILPPVRSPCTFICSYGV